MKRSSKPTRKRSAKRDLFAELSEGMDALADARQGKRTLGTVVWLYFAQRYSPAPLKKDQSAQLEANSN